MGAVLLALLLICHGPKVSAIPFPLRWPFPSSSIIMIAMDYSMMVEDSTPFPLIEIGVTRGGSHTCLVDR